MNFFNRPKILQKFVKKNGEISIGDYINERFGTSQNKKKTTQKPNTKSSTEYFSSTSSKIQAIMNKPYKSKKRFKPLDEVKKPKSHRKKPHTFKTPAQRKGSETQIRNRKNSTVSRLHHLSKNGSKNKIVNNFFGGSIETDNLAGGDFTSYNSFKTYESGGYEALLTKLRAENNKGEMIISSKERTQNSKKTGPGRVKKLPQHPSSSSRIYAGRSIFSFKARATKTGLIYQKGVEGSNLQQKHLRKHFKSASPGFCPSGSPDTSHMKEDDSGADTQEISHMVISRTDKSEGRRKDSENNFFSRNLNNQNYNREYTPSGVPGSKVTLGNPRVLKSKERSIASESFVQTGAGSAMSATDGFAMTMTLGGKGSHVSVSGTNKSSFLMTQDKPGKKFSSNLKFFLSEKIFIFLRTQQEDFS